jgi:hypothetical protein
MDKNCLNFTCKLFANKIDEKNEKLNMVLFNFGIGKMITSEQKLII